MNLYLLTQNINNSYDTYKSIVVSAHNEDDARDIHPDEDITHITEGKWMGSYSYGGEYIDCEEYMGEGGGLWVGKYSNIGCIKVKFLGETTEPRGLILASHEPC